MVYFVEILNLRILLLTCLPILLKGFIQSRKIIFKIIDKTSLGWLLGRLLAFSLGADIEVYQYRLRDVHDDNGLLIRLRIAFVDIGEINKELIKGQDFNRFVETFASEGRHRTYLEKMVSEVGIIFPGTMGRTLFFIELARWDAKKSGLNVTAPVYWIIQKPEWLHVINKYAAKINVHLLPVNRVFNSTKFLKNYVQPIFPSWLQVCRNILTYRRKELVTISYLQGFLHWIRGVKIKNNNNMPSVGAEYYGHLNVLNPEKYSDLFFWQTSKIPGPQVKMCFGLGGFPFNPSYSKELKSQNIQSVVVRPEATIDFSSPIYNLGKKIPYSQKSKYPFYLFNPDLRALKNKSLEYDRLKYNWSNIFKEENIKVYLSWFRYNSDMCAINDAIQENGGVMAIYQRSFDVFPSRELAVCTDIEFGFSASLAKLEQDSGSSIPYFIATGYLGDHRFSLLKPRAAVLRTELHNKGAKKIIAFFDEGSADDDRFHTGHSIQKSGYAYLAELVLRDPNLGLICKPKIPKSLRMRLGPVAEILKKAESTGRCKVIEQGTISGSFPPAGAAMAADIAIHNCLAAATAGLEARLAGVPTLLVDQEGWGISPLYKLGLNQIVFKDWDSVGEALELFWKGNLPKMGNWDEIINDIDNFRDGKASYRMSEYLEWLLDGFKKNLPRDKVLEQAAERYAKKWGHQNVISISPEKISTPFSLAAPI